MSIRLKIPLNKACHTSKTKVFCSKKAKGCQKGRFLCVKKSKDNFQGSVLSYTMEPKEQTEVISPGSKYLELLSHLVGPGLFHLSAQVIKCPGY